MTRHSGVRGAALGLLVLAAVVSLAIPSARAEVSELRIARQFGIAHLQMALLERLKLIEKHAQAAGLAGFKVSWTRFSDGPGMNDALLSGNLDVANGGLTALLVLLDRSRGAFVGLAPLSSMPAILMMRRPGVTGVKDLKDDDRIALIARVSMQAIILRMYAAKAFGRERSGELDRLTVALPHAQALASLTAGQSEITGHFTAAPYYQLEERAGLHRALNSYDLLGGPATYSVTYTAKAFTAANPTVTRVVLAAIEEATRIIREDPHRAAETYIAAEASPLDPALVEAIIRDPENVFTTTPQNTMAFVDFMAGDGLLKQPPKSWKDVFPLVADRPGS